MDLMRAAKIADWLEDTYTEYLQYLAAGGIPVKYFGDRSGNWDSGEAIRVSKIAKDCPRYEQAIARGLIEKRPLTNQELVKFEDAVRAAEVVYEAVQWGCDDNPNMNMEAEYRVKEHWTGLAGTLDIKLKIVLNMSKMDRVAFPIEVKRTDANKWWGQPQGATLDQFIQVVGEMVLLTENDYSDCEYGFLFSRYGSDSDPIVKVWTVRFDSDMWGWKLYYKSDIQSADSNSDWPKLPSGVIFLGVDDYEALVEKHKLYRAMDNPLEGNAPYKFLENWRCCKKVPTQYYSANGKNAGRVKDGTGIVTPRCPLFFRCFGNELSKAGFDTERVEYPLEALEAANND